MLKNSKTMLKFAFLSVFNTSKSDLIFEFTMTFYITYLPFFSTPLTYHA